MEVKEPRGGGKMSDKIKVLPGISIKLMNEGYYKLKIKWYGYISLFIYRLYCKILTKIELISENLLK